MKLKSSRCDFGKEVIFRKVDHPGGTSAKYSMVSSRLMLLPLLDELPLAAGTDVEEEAVDSSTIGSKGGPLVFSLLLMPRAGGECESSKVTFRLSGGALGISTVGCMSSASCCGES